MPSNTSMETLGVSPEVQQQRSPMSREFAALAYDNRVSDSGAWPAGLAAPPLIGTSAFHNVSLRVGRLAAQKPFSLHDRMTWLLETLPHASEAHIAFLDAGDVAWGSFRPSRRF